MSYCWNLVLRGGTIRGGREWKRSCCCFEVERGILSRTVREANLFLVLFGRNSITLVSLIC